MLATPAARPITVSELLSKFSKLELLVGLLLFRDILGHRSNISTAKKLQFVLHAGLGSREGWFRVCPDTCVRAVTQTLHAGGGADPA
jgi:hypothetical protein